MPPSTPVVAIMSTQQSRKRALSAVSVSSSFPESKRSRESVDDLSSKNLHLHNTLNSEPVYDIPPSLPTLIGRNSSSSENTSPEINDQVANAVRKSGVGLPPNSKTSSPCAIQHSLVQSLQHDVSVSTSDDESTISSAESDEPVEVFSRLHPPGQHGPSPPAHIIASTTSSMLSTNPSEHSVLDLSESNTISDYESDSPTSSSSSGYSSRASSPNMLPSLIPPLADVIPPQQGQHNLSRNSSLLPSIPSFTAGNRPAEYAPPIHVGVHERLMKFLPVIQAENETLEQERTAGRLAERNIENVDETGREYIEMDLGLGVLEERKQEVKLKDEEWRESESSSSDSESASDTNSASGSLPETNVLDRLMSSSSSSTKTKKPKKPKIEIL